MYAKWIYIKPVSGETWSTSSPVWRHSVASLHVNKAPGCCGSDGDELRGIGENKWMKFVLFDPEPMAVWWQWDQTEPEPATCLWKTRSSSSKGQNRANANANSRVASSCTMQTEESGSMIDYNSGLLTGNNSRLTAKLMLAPSVWVPVSRLACSYDVSTELQSVFIMTEIIFLNNSRNTLEEDLHSKCPFSKSTEYFQQVK